MGIDKITGLPGQQPARTGNGASRSEARTDGTGQRQKADAGTPPPARPATDSVTLTDTASRLRRLEESAAETPAIDSARVAEIRQALADGTFEVDPERIARKLIDFETELNR